MSNKKAQDFLAKKKEETKSKMKGKEEEGSKKRDTSKMPEDYVSTSKRKVRSNG